MLQTAVIDREADFLELGADWAELLSRSPQNHLYLTHPYLVSWWKNLARRAALRVITVRDDRRLLAAAPFMKVRGRVAAMPIRRLESLGSGWGYGGVVLSERKQDCLAQILNAVGQMTDWDLFFVPQMLGDPEIDSRDMLRPDWSSSVTHDVETKRIPYISLATTWDDYLKQRSYKFRRNIKNRDRRLRKLGQPRFVHITRLSAADESRETVMGWLRSIADVSWKAGQGTAISSSPEVFDFYSEFAARLDELGWLDLSLLFLDGRPIAYAFGAVYNHDYYEIDIAFDKELSKASPGVLLRNEVLQRLFDSGMRRFDFVMDFDYKKELTTESEEFCSHLLFRRKPYPLLLRFLKRQVRPRLRRWIGNGN